MISTDTINSKIRMLPQSSQKIVLDLIDRLLEQRGDSTIAEKIEAWKNFGNSTAPNKTVIRDSREDIYED